MPHKDYEPFQPYTTLVDRVQRGEFIRKIVSQVRAHEYPYEKRPPEKVSWSTYDIAQCNGSPMSSNSSGHSSTPLKRG